MSEVKKEKDPNITADIWSIKDYADDVYTMQVSFYQRGYRWIEEKVLQLLEDVRNAQSEDKVHLLGAVSLIHVHQDDDFMEVVDGQQRLTTITIALFEIARKITHILNYLKDLPIELRPVALELGAFINKGLFAQEKEGKIFLTFRRESEQESFNKFTKVVRKNHQLGWEGASYTPGEDINALDNPTLKAAALAIRNYLDALTNEEFVGFAEHFIKRTKIVTIMVADDVSAFQLFESLNDRGEGLRKIDLVRNSIFMNIGNSNINECENSIKKVDRYFRIRSGNGSDKTLDDLMTRLFTQYFECHIKGERIEEGQLYKVIKEYLATIKNGDPFDDKVFALVNAILNTKSTVNYFLASISSSDPFWAPFCSQDSLKIQLHKVLGLTDRKIFHSAIFSLIKCMRERKINAGLFVEFLNDFYFGDYAN